MSGREQIPPPRFEDLPDLLTPEQARAFLQIGRNLIYELVKSGEIRSVTFGKLIRIPKSALLHEDRAVRPREGFDDGSR